MEKQNKCSGRTEAMQRRLIIALFIQTAIPISLILAPVVYILVTAELNYYNQSLTNFIFLVVSMHGTVSALVMIFIHKPYRDATWNLFRWFSKR
ncbi:hypothetical protein B9Z55_016914 [Caenorhabditis nigoni]|uniref:G-protein coupled receptors family 1 profile domain-containing protein n=1 Tax=Caenorhabditis nigoni TaxID=1611254 RepID=A0A2G5T6T0_9PELO|nr:hypothetical protein B9Z55_016914 [Caenorhabditis nigoni]